MTGPTTPDPATPDPTTPDPDAPDPATPDPVTPDPTTRRDEADAEALEQPESLGNPPRPASPADEAGTQDTEAGLYRNSMVMAAGTLLSRGLGFVKNATIVATLGVALTADLYMIPWTIPASMYFLIAGGVLNAVLVPQIVRAIKNDADGGETYAQRVWSAVLAILFVATVILVIFAPQIIRIYAGDGFPTDQFDTMVAFARYCLPTIFFMGVFALLSQILTAKGSFAPMAFAPVLNNIVVIAVFGGFLLVYGPLDPRSGEYTPAEVAWFGLGSTMGIVAQAVVLIPVLRRVGFRMRLRTDLRGSGLGKAARLGVWSILFVVVNQVVFWVVIRISSYATANNPEEAAGITVYNMAYTLMMVPHGIITVSLATALLPQLSRKVATHDLPGASEDLVSTSRTALAIMMPVAVLMVALAVPITQLFYGYGAASGDVGSIAVTLIMFAPGLIFFTVHFMALRGFYALEDTRTPFFNQLLLGVVNVASAVVLVLVFRSPYAAAFLALAWTLGYLVGTIAALVTLSKRMPGLPIRETTVYMGRLLLATLPAGAAALAVVLLVSELAQGWLGTALMLGLGGIVGLLVYLAIAHLLRIREVGRALATLRARLLG